MFTLPDGGRLSYRGHDIQAVIEVNSGSTHLQAQVSRDDKLICTKSATLQGAPAQDMFEQFIADVFVRIDRELDGELIDLMRLPPTAGPLSTVV